MRSQSGWQLDVDLAAFWETSWSATRMSLNFSSGHKPPAKPAETTRQGRWPSIKASVARDRVLAAGTGEKDDHAAAVQSALAADETAAADRDHALQQVLKAARLDAEGEDQAEWSRLGLFGMERKCRLQILRLRGPEWPPCAALSLAACESQFCRIVWKGMRAV